MFSIINRNIAQHSIKWNVLNYRDFFFLFQMIHLFFSYFFSFPVWSLMVSGRQQYVQLWALSKQSSVRCLTTWKNTLLTKMVARQTLAKDTPTRRKPRCGKLQRRLWKRAKQKRQTSDSKQNLFPESLAAHIFFLKYISLRVTNFKWTKSLPSPRPP